MRGSQKNDLGDVSLELMNKNRAAGPTSAPVVVVLDAETSSLIERRCRNCQQMYTNATKDWFPCRYHPGRFRDPETTGVKSGAMVGWSCCSVSERIQMPTAIAFAGFMPGVSELVALDQSTLKKSAPGCYVNPVGHVEDLAYTQMMSHFPPDIVALRKLHNEKMQAYIARQTPGEPSTAASEQPPVDPPMQGSCFVHQVRDTDTLPGLALHYDVGVEAIRAANPNTIIGDIFRHNKSILIPRREGVVPRPHEPLSLDQIRRTVVRDFMKLAKVESQEEAMYYCESANFVLADAVAAYKEDLSATPK